MLKSGRRPPESGKKGGEKFICQGGYYLLKSSKHGALAQLGERLHGMQEVVGSNPIGSILIVSWLINTCPSVVIGLFLECITGFAP